MSINFDKESLDYGLHKESALLVNPLDTTTHGDVVITGGAGNNKNHNNQDGGVVAVGATMMMMEMNEDPKGIIQSAEIVMKNEEEMNEEITSYPGHFEGPEKTMEVVFRSDKGPKQGLKLLTRKQLNYLCDKAKCTIVHHIANQYIDAYVLSESSLFIYCHRYIMKTCGTTTLLHCLSSLLEMTDALGMELAYVGYSRKNLMFPSEQLWPHSSFHDEIRYLNQAEGLTNRLRGNGHILGPITGDHWFVYVADHVPLHPSSSASAAGDSMKSIAMESTVMPPSPVSSTGSSPSAAVSTKGSGGTSSGKSGSLKANINSYNNLHALSPAINGGFNERTINLMMFDMDRDVAKIFYQGENGLTGREMTQKAGIHYLCPGATIDELAFSPCGYSMNAILHDAYSTIHITPEPQCSYVSFETNTLLDNYTSMIRNVLTVFKPARFVLTMFGDQSSINSLKTLPTDQQLIMIPCYGIYQRTSCSSTQVDLELGCLMACYSLVREDHHPMMMNGEDQQSEVALWSNGNGINGNGNNKTRMMTSSKRNRQQRSPSTSSQNSATSVTHGGDDNGTVTSSSSNEDVFEDMAAAVQGTNSDPNTAVGGPLPSLWNRFVEKKERSYTWC